MIRVIKLHCTSGKFNDIPGQGTDARRATVSATATSIVKAFSPVFTEDNMVTGEFMEVNPRRPRYNKKKLQPKLVVTDVVNEIRDTVRNSPKSFINRNNGLSLLASETKLHDDSISITMDSENGNGLVNGGHTFASLFDLYNSCFEENPVTGETEVVDAELLANLNRAQVWVFVSTGIEPSEVPQLAEGLNTSLQVDDASMANLEGYFDEIKITMSAAGYPETLVAWKLGEGGPISAKKLIQILMTWNIDRYKSLNNPEGGHPTACYVSASKVLERYVEDCKDPETRSKMLALFKFIIPQILVIYDDIKASYLDDPTYRKSGKKKDAKGRNTGTTELSRGKVRYHFTSKTDDHGTVHEPFIIPVLSAFRSNIAYDETTSTFRWRVTDVQSLFHRIIKTLTGYVFGTVFRKDQTPPDKIGRDESVYAYCYDMLNARIEAIEAEKTANEKIAAAQSSR